MRYRRFYEVWCEFIDGYGFVLMIMWVGVWSKSLF